MIIRQSEAIMETMKSHSRGLLHSILRFLALTSILSLTSWPLLCSESVDPRSGKLQLDETDLTLPSGAVLLSVERIYDLDLDRAGLLGRGWRLSVEKRLARSGARAVLEEANQSIQLQQRPGTPVYVSDTGEEITFAPDGKAVRLKTDATSETFDAGGRLIEQRVRIGNVIRFQYDASGRLVRIAGAGGNFFKLTPDQSGRIARIESSTGMTVTYRYAGGSLAEVQTNDQPAIRYTYDAKSRLIRVADPRDGNVEFAYDDRNRIVSRTPAGSARERYEYDDMSGMIRHTDAAGGVTTTKLSADRGQQEITGPLGQKIAIRVDNAKRTVFMTSPSGAASTLKYDAQGRLISSVKEKEEIRLAYLGNTQLPVTITYPDRSQQTFEYDRDHNLIAVREDGDLVTSFTYNEDGTLASEKYRGSGEWRYQYSPDGRVKARTDAEGQTVRFAYDRHGNVIRRTDALGGTISFAYDDQDRLVSYTDAGGATTKYGYDAAGRLLTWTDPLGAAARFEYDAGDRLLAKTDAAGRITRYKYDAAGRRVAIVYPGGAVYSYEYDAASNVSRAINPLGGETRYRYDPEGQVTGITEPTGRTWKYEFSSPGRLAKIISPAAETTEFHYDGFGRAEGFIDPAGRTVRYERDPKGRLAKVTFPDGRVRTVTYDKDGNLAGNADNRGEALLYEHDALGRVIQQRSSAGLEITSRFDAAGHLAGFRDNLGQSLLIRHTPAGQISALMDSAGSTIQFGYDRAGHLTEITDPLGKLKHLTYSAGGELFSVQEPNGDTAQFGYDEAGRITSIRHPGGGATRFEYDAMNHPIRISDPLGARTSFRYDEAGFLSAITDPDGRSTSLSYDLAGRLSQRLQPDGKLVTYKYDQTGKIHEVDDGQYPVQYTYNPAGRLTAIKYPTIRKAQKYEYDSAGLLIRIAHPNGQIVRYAYDDHKRVVAMQFADNSTIRFSYDAGGRLTSLSYPNGVTGVWQYSPAGNVSRIAYSNSSGQVICGWAYTYDAAGNLASVTDHRGRATRYEYDGAGQLTKEDGPAGMIRYGYAPGGNRATRDSGSQTMRYEYNAADQLLKAGDETFSYDKRGNLIERKGPAGTTHYTFNEANRLIKATLPDGNEVSFGYSAAGDRVWRRDRSGTTHFVTDGFDLLAELDENLKPKISYIYAPGIDRPIALMEGQKTLFYHFDRLGSIAALTDAAANTAATYETDAFGAPVSLPKGTPNHFIFNAHEYEPDLGLYYYRARYFDPALGRFISRDPAPVSLTQVDSLNPYAYVSNNSTRFVDPLGLQRVPVPSWNELVTGQPLTECPFCQQPKTAGEFCPACTANRRLYGNQVLDDQFIWNNYELSPEQLSDLADFAMARYGAQGPKGPTYEMLEARLCGPDVKGMKGQALYNYLREEIFRNTEGPEWDVRRIEVRENAQRKSQWQEMLAKERARQLQSSEPVSSSADNPETVDSPAPPAPPPPTVEETEASIEAARNPTIMGGAPPPAPRPEDLTTKIPATNPGGNAAELSPAERYGSDAAGYAGALALGLHGTADYVETRSGWVVAKRAGIGTFKGLAITATIALVSAPAAVVAGVGLAGYGVYTGVERFQYDSAIMDGLDQLDNLVSTETSKLAELQAAANDACQACQVSEDDAAKARTAITSAKQHLDALQTLIGPLKDTFAKCGDAATLQSDLNTLSSKATQMAGDFEQKLGVARLQAGKCESEQLVRTAQADYESCKDFPDQLKKMADVADTKAAGLKVLKDRLDTARADLTQARLWKGQVASDVAQFVSIVVPDPDKVAKARSLKAQYDQERDILKQKVGMFRGDNPQALPPAFELRFTEIRKRVDQIPETIDCTPSPGQDSSKQFGANADDAKAIQSTAESALAEVEQVAANCAEIAIPDDTLESIRTAAMSSSLLASNAQDIPDLLAKCLQNLPGAGSQNNDAGGGFNEVESTVGKDTSGGETQGGFQEVESPSGKETTEEEQTPSGFDEVDSSVGKDLGADRPAQNQPGTGGGSTAGPALQVRPAAALAAGQPAAYHIFATGSRLGWAGGLARYSEGPADQAIIDHLMAAGEHARMANFESYPPTKAWPGWTQIKAQFTSWAQLIARYRNDTVRRQVATAVPGSAQTLETQLSVQTVGTTVQVANCDAAYMRLGFYLSYGQQTLSIAQEAATHHGSSELVARAQADAVNHLVEADRILINYQNIRVASGRCADLRDVRAQLEALLRVPNILGQVPAVIAAWKTALERIMALSAAGTPSSTSYDECLKKYCPMCGQAISLLGVSAANDCDPCKTRNAQLISACVAGGQSQAARQQPSGPPARVGTTGAASQRAQTQPKDPGELEGTWFLCACNILGGRPRMYWMDNSGPHTLAEFVNYCSKARTQYHSAQEMSANHGQIPDFLVQFTKSGGQYSGKNAPGSRRLTGEDPMWDINHHQPFEEMYRLARTGPGSYQGQGLACHSCTPGSPLVWSPTTITMQGDVATENTFGNAGSPYQQVWVRTASPPAGAGQPAAPSQRTNYPNSINLLGVEAPAAPSPKPQ